MARTGEGVRWQGDGAGADAPSATSFHATRPSIKQSWYFDQTRNDKARQRTAK